MASEECILYVTSTMSRMTSKWVQDEVTDRIWAAGLKNFPDDLVYEALDIFIQTRTSNFGDKCPLPGDLASIITEKYCTTWEQAWDEICAKAHASLYPLYSMGRFLEVEWSSPDIPLLMDRMGGADVFISQSKEQMGTNRAQFRQMFENHVAQAGPIIPPNSPLLAAKQDKQIGAKQPFRPLEIEGYDV